MEKLPEHYEHAHGTAFLTNWKILALFLRELEGEDFSINSFDNLDIDTGTVLGNGMLWDLHDRN